MTFQGHVQNGVVVLNDGSQLPEGTQVTVTALPAPSPAAPKPQPPYPVSEEKRQALLGLIGCCKTDNPPDDEEVERIIEEYRMKKYG